MSVPNDYEIDIDENPSQQNIKFMYKQTFEFPLKRKIFILFK